MKRMKTCVWLAGLCIVAWCYSGIGMPGELPLTLKILSGGAPHTGPVDIKLAIIEKDSEQVCWTSDGSLQDPPLTGVSAEAVNGRCAVKLGDMSVPTMTALSPEIFSTTNALLLRIYLRIDTNDVYEALSPDMAFEAAAYSFMSQNAVHLAGKTENAFASTGMVDQLYLSVSDLAGDLQAHMIENDISNSGLVAKIESICSATNHLQQQIMNEKETRRKGIAELKTNILDITSFVNAADTNILDMINRIGRTSDVYYTLIAIQLAALSNTAWSGDVALSNLIERTADAFYSTSKWNYTCFTNSLAVLSNEFRHSDGLLAARINGLSNEFEKSSEELQLDIEQERNARVCALSNLYSDTAVNIVILSNRIIAVSNVCMLAVNSGDTALSNLIERTADAFYSTSKWNYTCFTNSLAVLSNEFRQSDGLLAARINGLSNELEDSAVALQLDIEQERNARISGLSSLQSDMADNIVILSNRIQDTRHALNATSAWHYAILSNCIVDASNAAKQYVDTKVFTADQIGAGAVTSDKIDDYVIQNRHIDSVAADKITAAPWVNRNGDVMTGVLTTKGIALYGTEASGYTVSGGQAYPAANGFYQQTGMCGEFPLYRNQSNCVMYMAATRHLYGWNIGLTTNGTALYNALASTSPQSPTYGWPNGVAVVEDTIVVAPEINIGKGYLRNLAPAEKPGDAVTFEQLDDTMTERQVRENEIESMIDILYTYVKTCTTGAPPERLMDAVGSGINFDNYLTITNGTMISGHLTLANPPSKEMHAVTKKYVDSSLAMSISNAPGNFTGPVHAWSRGGQTIETCAGGTDGIALPSVWQSFTLPHDSRLKHIALQPTPGTGGDFLHVQFFAGLPDGNNHICEFYLDQWPSTVNLHFNDLALTAGVYSIKCQYLGDTAEEYPIGLRGTYTAMNDPYPGGSYTGMSDYDAWLEINYDLDTSTIGEGTPDNNLGSNGLYVTGGIEVDRTAYFDGDILIKGSNINDMFLRKNSSDEQSMQGPLTVAANGNWTVGTADTRSDIVIKHGEGSIRSDNGDLALDAGDNTIIARSPLVLNNQQAGKATIPAGESGVQVSGIAVSHEAVIIVTPCQPVNGTPYVDVHPDGTFTIGLPCITEGTTVLNYVVLKK